MPSKKKNKRNKNKNNNDHNQAENPEIKDKEENVNIDQEDNENVSENEKQEVKKVVARIFGEDFCIKGDLAEEDIKKIAELVDYKMTEIFDKHPTLSSQKIAVLAALNIAEEYLRLEKDHKELLALMDERDLANGS